MLLYTQRILLTIKKKQIKYTLSRINLLSVKYLKGESISYSRVGMIKQSPFSLVQNGKKK